MSDKITINELKVFVGTGLKCECEGNIWTFDGLDTSEESESAVLSRPDIECGGRRYGLYTGLDCFKPIVSPWSHLTKEIEVDGKRFVPMYKLFGVTDEDVESGKWMLGTSNNRWTTLSNESCSSAMSIDHNIRSLGYLEICALSSWHFDLFNWLNRTDADGNPLAVEMEG